MTAKSSNATQTAIHLNDVEGIVVSTPIAAGGGRVAAKRWRLAALVALVVCMPAAVTAGPAAAQQSAPTAHYLGADGNWFNAANWSTGRVPAADTDVVLDAVDNVTIDPLQGPAEVQIRDLVVRDTARLSTLPGTILRTREERLAGLAAVTYRATEGYGERLSAEGCLDCHMILNPNPKNKRFVILQLPVVAQLGWSVSSEPIVGAAGGVPLHAIGALCLSRPRLLPRMGTSHVCDVGR